MRLLRSTAGLSNIVLLHLLIKREARKIFVYDFEVLHFIQDIAPIALCRNYFWLFIKQEGDKKPKYSTKNFERRCAAPAKSETAKFTAAKKMDFMSYFKLKERVK